MTFLVKDMETNERTHKETFGAKQEGLNPVVAIVGDGCLGGSVHV